MTEQQATTNEQQPPTMAEAPESSWIQTLIRDRARAWVFMAALLIPAAAIVLLALRNASPVALMATVLPPVESMSVDPGSLVALETTRQAAMTALRRYQHQLKDVSEVHEQLQQQILAWQNEIEPTLKNDSGQFLAPHSDLVRRFSATYQAPRFTQADLDAAKSRVHDLLVPIDDALVGKGTLFNPDDDAGKTLPSQIQEERELVQQALTSLRQGRSAAVALLEQAKALGKKADYTLAEAMDREERGLALDITQKTASLHEQARREAAELEAQALAEQTRKLARQRVAQIEAETTAKAQELKKQLRLDAEQAARKRLQDMANDPAIQAKFQPFLAKGRCRPLTYAGRYPYPMPASFKDIESTRALNDVQRFVWAGSGHLLGFFHNDRPRWQQPNTEAEWKDFEERYNLFRQLAPLWIEMGLLQP